MFAVLCAYIGCGVNGKLITNLIADMRQTQHFVTGRPDPFL